MQISRKLRRFVVVFAALGALALISQRAKATTYTSSAAFAAATAGITTDDFSSNAAGALVPDGSSLGGLTYTFNTAADLGGVISSGFYNSFSGNSLSAKQASGGLSSDNFFLVNEGFTVILPTAITGFAFSNTNLPVVATLSTSSGTAAPHSRAYDTSTFGFLGFTSDTPFTSITFTSSIFNIPLIEYGSVSACARAFYMGDAASRLRWHRLHGKSPVQQGSTSGARCGLITQHRPGMTPAPRPALSGDLRRTEPSSQSKSIAQVAALSFAGWHFLSPELPLEDSALRACMEGIIAAGRTGPLPTMPIMISRASSPRSVPRSEASTPSRADRGHSRGQASFFRACAADFDRMRCSTVITLPPPRSPGQSTSTCFSPSSQRLEMKLSRSWFSCLISFSATEMTYSDCSIPNFLDLISWRLSSRLRSCSAMAMSSFAISIPRYLMAMARS